MVPYSNSKGRTALGLTGLFIVLLSSTALRAQCLAVDVGGTGEFFPTQCQPTTIQPFPFDFPGGVHWDVTSMLFDVHYTNSMAMESSFPGGAVYRVTGAMILTVQSPQVAGPEVLVYLPCEIVLDRGPVPSGPDQETPIVVLSGLASSPDPSTGFQVFDIDLAPAGVDGNCRMTYQSFGSWSAYGALRFDCTLTVQGDATSPMGTETATMSTTRELVFGNALPVTGRPPPVEEIACSVVGGDTIGVSWTLGSDAYDEIEVVVDGTTYGLAGTATEFTTTSLLPGEHEICVRAVWFGVESTEVCCVVDVATPSVEGLVCSIDPGGYIVIAWSSPVPYDSFVVTRSFGANILIPDGTTTEILLGAPEGESELCVIGVWNGVPSEPACCTVDYVAPIDVTGAIVVVALEDSAGLVDSASALESAIAAATTEDVTVVDTLVGLVGNPTHVFVALGTFPANHALDEAEGQVLADFVVAGVPVYVEGGDAWGYDALTPFGGYDGVDDEDHEDGDDGFTGMIGLDYSSAVFAGLAAAYTQDNAANDWTDRLQVADPADLAGANSGVVWQDDDEGYNTGIYYDTDEGFGKVLVQSWEFGGYGGDPVALMTRYLTALDGAPVFRRGDANGDGAFDIGDAISTLGALFSGGTSAGCADAADANDDGQVDIGDAIFTLGALFSAGTAPPAPGSTSCGVDPTADDLGCESGCP